MTSVDVLVPCYNYGRFLRECVRSILTQEGVSVRILIIDDASTDDSKVIASALALEDDRISFVSHEKNRGHIATYNEGIEWASAEYFILLSADDLLAPNALARATALMEMHPSVTLTYGGEFVLLPDAEAPSLVADDTKRCEWTIQTGRDFIAELCRSGTCPVPTCTAIVRTSAQKGAGGYCPELPHAGDLENWLRLAAFGDVAKTNAVQGIRRLHGSNMSVAYFGNLISEFRQRATAFDMFFRKHEAGDTDTTLRKQAYRTLAIQAYWFGVSHLRRGRISNALHLFGFAWQLSPRSVLIPPLRYLSEPNRPGFSLFGSGVARGHEAELLHRHQRQAVPAGRTSREA